MQGFQKPLDSGKRKEVGLAVVRAHDSMFVSCSCGWTYGHIRAKVREDAIDKHFDKKHEGRGIRL